MFEKFGAELAKYLFNLAAGAHSWNTYPVAWAVGGILFVFGIWRKFGQSEYVTGGKENWEELKSLYDAVRTENKDLKEDFEVIKKQIVEYNSKLADRDRMIADQKEIIQELRNEIATLKMERA